MRKSKFSESQIVHTLKQVDGVLDMYMFRNLNELREHTERWLNDYNEEIPHNAPDGLTPVAYRQFHSTNNSSYAWT